MATVFEILLFENSVDAELVSNAIFEEIDRIEQELSYFIPSSDIFRFNRLQAGQPLRLGVSAFDCITLAKEVYTQTNGAFDPTAGALIAGRKPWDEQEENPIGGIVPPESEEMVQVGMDAIAIDTESHSATKLADGVTIDLGGIGKGYALDQAKTILEDWGIETALIHAGQSTSLPLGAPPDQKAWPMRILDPRNEKDELARFELQNMVISASASINDSHILDPFTGAPVEKRLGAWAIAATGATADALSTAFMVMDSENIRRYCEEHSDVWAFLVEIENNQLGIKYFGDWKRFSLELVF